MLRMTFLAVSLTMLAGGAYAAQSALDIQTAAYAGPAAVSADTPDNPAWHRVARR